MDVMHYLHVNQSITKVAIAVSVIQLQLVHVIIAEIMVVAILVWQIRHQMIQIQSFNGLVKKPITLTLTLVHLLVQVTNTQVIQLVKVVYLILNPAQGKAMAVILSPHVKMVGSKVAIAVYHQHVDVAVQDVLTVEVMVAVVHQHVAV